MSGLLTILRCSVLMLACAVMASAGIVRVFPGELTGSSGTARGRLLVHDNYLVFLDEERPESSFSIPRADMENFSADGNVVSAQLKQSFRDRFGERNMLTFRLGNAADGITLQRWYTSGQTEISSSPATPGTPSTPGIPAVGAAASSASGTTSLEFSWPVQQKRRFGGDRSGRLMLAGDTLIFESIENPSDSRRWSMRQIKALEHKNPYHLEVQPFTEDSYTFELVGAPMEPTQYKVLVDRVTAARVR